MHSFFPIAGSPGVRPRQEDCAKGDAHQRKQGLSDILALPPFCFVYIASSIARLAGGISHPLLFLLITFTTSLPPRNHFSRQYSTSLCQTKCPTQNEIQDRAGKIHLRQAQGIVRQADRYGAQRLDAACARALTFGDPSYRTVKQILERGLDNQPLPQTIDGRVSGAAMLHGRDTFALKNEGGVNP